MRSPLMMCLGLALIALAVAAMLTPSVVNAQGASGKLWVPDCSAQDKAVQAAHKALGSLKLDLSPCKGMTGANRSKCERPIRDAYNKALQAARKTEAEAKKTLACCQRPTSAGCPGTGSYIR